MDAPVTEQRTLFETVRLVFRAANGNWRTCLRLAAPYAILLGVLNGVTRVSTGIFDPTTVTATQAFNAGLAFFFVAAALVLVHVLVLPVSLGALSLVGSAAVYGDAIDGKGIWKRALDRALDAIGVILVIALVLGGAFGALGIVSLAFGALIGPEAAFGILIFVGLLLLIPALYVFVRLALAIPIVMREGKKAQDALKRSWHLVTGASWWVFGVAVVVALTVALINVVVSYVSLIGRDTPIDFVIGGIFSAVAAAAFATLFGVASGVIYATRVPEDVVAPVTPAAPIEPPPAEEPPRPLPQ